MDGDPAVEPEIDGLSLILPLPYRISILLVLGIYLYAVTLRYLEYVHIDLAALIKYPSRQAQGHVPHYRSATRLATVLTIPLGISILLFWTITRGDISTALKWQILPQSYFLFLVVTFLLPIKRLSRSGRLRFLSTLKRISIGGIAEVQDGKFGDILLADALTSYAKVLGDLFVSTCMLLSKDQTSTAKPNRGCGGAYLVPLVISIPSIIRLRQCLIEFIRVRRRKQPGSGWGGQHLANALKYSTAFPVIVLSALQRSYDSYKLNMSETGLFRLWLLFVFLNSFYSFYWDVAKDWDLTLFSSRRARNDPAHPWGLRQHRYFHAKQIYYVVIVMDFMLRCTWSFKLSPHLDHFNDLEGGIFLMEFLEIIRRWIWTFLRVECEYVRTNRIPDDVLLGDFAAAKADED